MTDHQTPPSPTHDPNRLTKTPKLANESAKDNVKRNHLNRSSFKPFKWLFLLLLFAIAVFAVMTYQTLYGKTDREAHDMVIDEGQSYFGLLPTFEEDVPLFSDTIAKAYIKFAVDMPLHAGTYEMPANFSLTQMLDTITKPPKIEQISVQIIEGKTAKELYDILAATDGVMLEVLQPDGTPKGDIKTLLDIEATTPDGEFADNLEGWFAPNTYHYNKGTTDKQILHDLYQRQQAFLDEAWANRAADLPYATPYDALIMASIIEKETSVTEERSKVSAVFVNRLRQGMRLQTDPTIIYGMGERYDGDIKRRDIREKTAYNTYQIDGLPPTPIALPSQAAIEAAMHPADFDALYFVATGTGGHKFSKTLAEHNKAVQEYLKVIRAQNND